MLKELTVELTEAKEVWTKVNEEWKEVEAELTEADRAAKEEWDEAEKVLKELTVELTEAKVVWVKVEAELTEAEAERTKVVDERTKAEAERTEAEAERTKAEAERTKAEAERTEAVDERTEAEAERTKVVDERTEAEAERTEAEAERTEATKRLDGAKNVLDWVMKLLDKQTTEALKVQGLLDREFGSESYDEVKALATTWIEQKKRTFKIALGGSVVAAGTVGVAVLVTKLQTTEETEQISEAVATVAEIEADIAEIDVLFDRAGMSDLAKEQVKAYAAEAKERAAEAKELVERSGNAIREGYELVVVLENQIDGVDAAPTVGGGLDANTITTAEEKAAMADLLANDALDKADRAWGLAMLAKDLIPVPQETPSPIPTPA